MSTLARTIIFIGLRCNLLLQVDTSLKSRVIYRSVCVLPELSIGFFLMII